MNFRIGEEENNTNSLFADIFETGGDYKQDTSSTNPHQWETQSVSDGMNFFNFGGSEESQPHFLSHISNIPNENQKPSFSFHDEVEAQIRDIEYRVTEKRLPNKKETAKPNCPVNSLNNNKHVNYGQIKRHRLEDLSIAEAREEEEEFYPEPRQLKVKEDKVKSSGGVKTVNFTRNEPKLKIEKGMKRDPVNYEPVVVERSDRNKKVAIVETDEARDAMMQEWAGKYEELEKQYLEKKEALKKVDNLSKLYQEYYVKLENFKAKLPTYIEKSLQGYHDSLAEYEAYCQLDDPEIDEIIRENNERILRIKEKFGLDNLLY